MFCFNHVAHTIYNVLNYYTATFPNAFPDMNSSLRLFYILFKCLFPSTTVLNLRHHPMVPKEPDNRLRHTTAILYYCLHLADLADAFIQRG